MTDTPAADRLHHILSRQAALQPDAPALWGNGRATDYTSLGARAQPVFFVRSALRADAPNLSTPGGPSIRDLLLLGGMRITAGRL